MLCSVGLDVGTTSTQMVVSELTVVNRGSPFAVPEMEIARRAIRYRSPVYFTPLKSEELVDADGLREIVEKEYRAAGITRESVDTGAVIITGETSRKENARAVLSALSDLAGDFVVATAGPDLESVLAAKGAGAADYSAETGKTVLHFDIGGGTANMALIRDGVITDTGCLNVGGRLLKFDENGTAIYLSPVLRGKCDLRIGDRPSREQVEKIAEMLTSALEMAAGLREETALLAELTTEHPMAIPKEPVTVSFSGGVADCIGKTHPFLAFGDMGPELGTAIRKSRLCAGDFVLGRETIRATVIGAGSHSAQLSGSTVFCRNVTFPLKNIPVAVIENQEDPTEEIRRKLSRFDQPGAIALKGFASPRYSQVTALADAIAAAAAPPVTVVLEQDMAKALGQALSLRLGEGAACLCIDRVRLREGSYLDVGAPVGPALPVVVKTIILSGERG